MTPPGEDARALSSIREGTLAMGANAAAPPRAKTCRMSMSDGGAALAATWCIAASASDAPLGRGRLPGSIAPAEGLWAKTGWWIKGKVRFSGLGFVRRARDGARDGSAIVMCDEREERKNARRDSKNVALKRRFERGSRSFQAVESCRSKPSPRCVERRRDARRGAQSRRRRRLGARVRAATT